MADSLYGYTDSFTTRLILGPSSGFPILDYDKDFAVHKEDNSVVLQNITTPVDQPESIRYAIYDVANVYKNTDIQPVHRQNGVKGKKLMVSLLDTARVTDGDGVITDYPVKVSMAVEFPLSSSITSANIFKVVNRCYSAAQDYMKINASNVQGGGNASADESLLNQLLRGALNPQDGILDSDRATS